MLNHVVAARPSAQLNGVALDDSELRSNVPRNGATPGEIDESTRGVYTDSIYDDSFPGAPNGGQSNRCPFSERREPSCASPPRVQIFGGSRARSPIRPWGVARALDRRSG